jgi:hypothetical protein
MLASASAAALSSPSRRHGHQAKPGGHEVIALGELGIGYSRAAELFRAVDRNPRIGEVERDSRVMRRNPGSPFEPEQRGPVVSTLRRRQAVLPRRSR